MPSRIRPTALAFIAAFACVALMGCSADDSLHAGKVVDDVVEVQAPALPVPSVDSDAGFATGSGSSSAGGMSGSRSTASTAVALTGLTNVVRVTSIAVKTGDRVSAGTEIARLDSRSLDANVAVAKAKLSTSRAQAGLLSETLDTLASSRSTLASKRSQIDDAANQLTSTRAKLAAQLSELEALLAKVEAMGGGTQRPPGAGSALPVRPGSTPPQGTLPDPKQLRAGIAKLTAALAKLDAGLVKVDSGRAKIASASAKLTDARGQLKDLRRLALVGVDGAEVGVQVAEYQRQLAVVRAPVDGVVVSVSSVGDVLAPGAPIADIRRSGAPRVTTWLAPDALGGVRVGTPVEVRADWFPGGPGSLVIQGRVTSISARADYPPTSFTTSEIHLTRAIPVEMTLSDTADQPALPPGTPVDVRFPKN